METISFLNLKLNTLFDKFNFESIRYGIKNELQSHLIDVHPKSMFLNVDFAKEFLAIAKEFNKQFPEENLILLPENSLNKIESTLYLWCRNNSSEIFAQIKQYATLKQLELFQNLEYSEKFLSNFSINKPNKNKIVPTNIQELLNIVCTEKPKHSNKCIEFNTSDNHVVPGENNYALAA